MIVHFFITFSIGSINHAVILCHLWCRLLVFSDMCSLTFQQEESMQIFLSAWAVLLVAKAAWRTEFELSPGQAEPITLALTCPTPTARLKIPAWEENTLMSIGCDDYNFLKRFQIYQRCSFQLLVTKQTSWLVIFVLFCWLFLCFFSIPVIICKRQKL